MSVKRKYSLCTTNACCTERMGEARWPSDRASDFGARGRGFDPHSGRRVVSLRKIHLPPQNTGNTKEAVAASRHCWKNC